MLNRKKQKIDDLTTQLESLTQRNTALETEKNSLSNNLAKWQTDYAKKENEVAQLHDQLVYLRENTVPSLEQKLTTEQQHYKQAQETFKTEAAKLLQNQDINVVGANLSSAVDKIYKTALQEKLADIKQRATEWTKQDMFDSYFSSEDFAHFPELDVEVDAVRAYVHDKDAILETKISESDKGTPQAIFSQAKVFTGAEFKENPAYQLFKEKFEQYEEPAIDFNNLADDDVFLFLKKQDGENQSVYADVRHFAVKADKENAYGVMVKQDVPLLITAAAIGAFENALGNEQYAMARQIADKYITSKTSTVFAPLIKDIAEQDPKAAGYFTNMQLNE